MIENTVKRSEQLMHGLKALQGEYPGIGEVRGLGLMVGVEFRDEDGKPDKAATDAISKSCLEQKLMLLTCGTWGNTIRWIPPLIVSEEEIAKGLSLFERALETVYQ